MTALNCYHKNYDNEIIYAALFIQFRNKLFYLLKSFKNIMKL